MSFVYFISLKKVKKKEKKSQLNQRNKKNHSSFYVVKDSSYITSKSLIINISNRLNISIYIYIYNKDMNETHYLFCCRNNINICQHSLCLLKEKEQKCL